MTSIDEQFVEFIIKSLVGKPDEVAAPVPPRAPGASHRVRTHRGRARRLLTREPRTPGSSTHRTVFCRGFC